MMTPLQKGRFWLNPTNKVCIFHYGRKSFFVYGFPAKDLKRVTKNFFFSACHMNKHRKFT